MLCERLAVVQKDRDHMQKRVQDQARQQGKSYEDIFVRDVMCVVLSEMLDPS